MSQPTAAIAPTLPDFRCSSALRANLVDANLDCTGMSFRQPEHPPAGRRPSILIRPATADDAVAIWQVLKAAVTTLIERAYTREQVDAWIADEDPAKLPPDVALRRTVLVAESERRVIGFSRLGGTEVEALYVHPAQAGRKAGELLLATLEQSAWGCKVKTLYLDAAINAVSFYESAGYKALGPSMPVFDNGVTLPCVRMQKTLRFQSSRKAGIGVGLHRCRLRNQVLLPAPASASGAPSSWPLAFSRKIL